MSFNDRDLWGKVFRAGVALWLTCGSLGAAALTVAPGSIASGSSAAITVSVVGLTNQQSVLIEEFRDTNGNGVVDPGEELLLKL